MQQVASHHKRERTIEDSSIKEQDDDYVQQLKKVATSSSRKRINDFKCQAFFQGHIFDFQLSQPFFQSATYAVLFFCPSPQSKDDMRHIEENYSKFIQRGAFPIVITHDGAHIHSVYATPGKAPQSLDFKPSFLLASDGMDRLISTSFKTTDMETSSMIRSVIIIDNNMHVVFSHRVPQNKYFPMKAILGCFQQ